MIAKLKSEDRRKEGVTTMIITFYTKDGAFTTDKFKSKQKFNIKKINLYQGLVSYTQIYDQKEQISSPFI